MARPLTVNIPHALGKDEARHRIAAGFGRLREQFTGGVSGLVTIQERWEGDILFLSGGGFGQSISGSIEIMDDSVKIQINLPDFLAGVADVVAQKLRTEGRKLLERRAGG